MQDPNGKIIWGAGVYKEIIENKKIVWTDHFADKNGNLITAEQAGMFGDWPKELCITLDFESIDTDQTKVMLSHEGIPTEMHHECTMGWNESFDKLQKIVELS